jgi:hypothetical protein
MKGFNSDFKQFLLLNYHAEKFTVEMNDYTFNFKISKNTITLSQLYLSFLHFIAKQVIFTAPILK